MSAALEGRTAVVTGGAGQGAGLGRGLVKCLAAAGMNVAILDVDRDAASALALELRNDGREALGLGVDVTSLESLQAAAGEVTRVFGSCNVLCAHVGGGGQGRFVDLPLEAWGEAMQLMVTGTVATVHAFLPLMQRAEGLRRIVLTASVAALAPGRYQGPYRAAKAAVMSIGETLDLELGPEGIGTTIVFPGGMVPPALARPGPRTQSVAARPGEQPRDGHRSGNGDRPDGCRRRRNRRHPRSRRNTGVPALRGHPWQDGGDQLRGPPQADRGCLRRFGRSRLPTCVTRTTKDKGSVTGNNGDSLRRTQPGTCPCRHRSVPRHKRSWPCRGQVRSTFRVPMTLPAGDSLIATRDEEMRSLLAGMVDEDVADVERMPVGDGAVYKIVPAGCERDSPNAYLEIHGGALIMGGGECCRITGIMTALRAGSGDVGGRLSDAPRPPLPGSARRLP